ncbi:MAG: cupin domain-containing protein [Actinobacteria bacterium]|nr:cupin domain-containing protein [Actinomycetota bacterium]
MKHQTMTFDERGSMLTLDTNTEELVELASEIEPDRRVRVAFPTHSASGAASTATVIFELEPDARLGRHTDSAEEILLVLAGAGEVSVGDETGALATGEAAVVPAMVPHDIRNTGERPLRVLGFFSSSTVVATFDHPPVEGGPQLFVIGAPVEVALPLGEPSTIAV